MVHRLWCEKLIREPAQVGIHDHFAELGGGSLHAIAVVAELERIYAIPRNLELLLDYDTIVQLAAYIDKRAGLMHQSSAQRTKKFRG